MCFLTHYRAKQNFNYIIGDDIMYILTEMEISRILSEGTFDSKKYSSSKCITGWKVGNLLNFYLEDNKDSKDVKKFKKIFDKEENKEKIYKLISNFYLDEIMLNKEEKQLMKQMKDLIKKINNGDCDYYFKK